jgi:hypothetical protein
MLIVGNNLVSEDVRDVCFCCNPYFCLGKCCVEGDGGAPLLKEEIGIIEKYLPEIKPYIPQEHLQVIENKGFYYTDSDNECCTSLFDDEQCVFVYFERLEKGGKIAKCAIEKAFEDGKTDFQKPVSCHLYPIRISDYGEFNAVNFHHWQEVCNNALGKGQPLYKLLKTPLVRRFGKDWYEELVVQCEQKPIS